MKNFLFLFTFGFVSSCEEANISVIADAGFNAVNAITLSEQEIKRMASEAARELDGKNSIAPSNHPYHQRLQSIVQPFLSLKGPKYDFKVYLSSSVNAFAMADGTIRVYSGLMDKLTDDELRFVIGHEIGHVILKHSHNQLKLAHASDAVRQAVGASSDVAGELARSELGAFAQKLLGAQFSQFEEKEADDFGLQHMKQQAYPTEAAVTALRKLDSLGGEHSFLSSHPDAGKRAERLQLQIEGKAHGIIEKKQELKEASKGVLDYILEKIKLTLEWLLSLFG